MKGSVDVTETEPLSPTTRGLLMVLLRRLFALARELDRTRDMPDDEWVQLVRETWQSIESVRRLAPECVELMRECDAARAGELEH